MDSIWYKQGVLNKEAMECKMFAAFYLNTELCSRDQCFVPKKGNYSPRSAGYMQSLCLAFSLKTLAVRLLILNLPFVLRSETDT